MPALHRIILPRVRIVCLLLLFSFIATTRTTAAPRLTASLDRTTITLGETATLNLKFDEGAPAQPPAIAAPLNLDINYSGQSTEMRMFNLQTQTSLNYRYQVTPSQPGDYVIPALQVVVQNQTLQSQPLRLKVLKSDAATPGGDNVQLAFLRLNVSKDKVYLGEVFPIELQLFFTDGREIQMPQVQSDGFVMGKIPQPPSSQTQLNGRMYNVVTFQMSATAVKTGTLQLGPAQCNMVLFVPLANRRARDPFDAFFDNFETRFQRRSVTVKSASQPIEVLPLPGENKPADFNGAVGQFIMSVQAAPTNVVADDPITLKVQISGKGALDAVPFPVQNNWSDFKLYTPDSHVETRDPLGLTGVKSFEQVVIPQTAQTKEIPRLAFSFFDPEARQYRTLGQAAIPISVRAGSTAQPQPTVLAGASATQEKEPPATDIVHIKVRPGTLAQLQPPLVQQSWFLALQGLPVLLWLSAFAWRKRQEAFAKDPRLRRRVQVHRIVRDGLREMNQLAAEHRTEDFFATGFHLLQEQLGERLDLPANAITEAALEDLRAHGPFDELIATLHELFQLCNQARYAPQQTVRELQSLVPRFETALRELQDVKEAKEV